MAFAGEILALSVAVLWTISSLASEEASRHYGSITLNIVRMAQAVLFIGLTLWVTTGNPMPIGTTTGVWGWLALSALTGYIIGDYFFLRCFMLIGARWGELFMTIAPVAAALTGWMLLGERMGGLAILGMLITTAGIAMSVLSKPEGEGKIKIKLPLKGVVYGIIAGVGQGVGLVFSKQGMLLYQDQLAEQVQHLTAFDSFYMSFASTMIRCLVALAGFMMMYAYQRYRNEKGCFVLSNIFNNKRIFWLATLSTITGPFIGVALSLAASLYTSTGITQTIMSLVPVIILYPSHLIFKTRITFLEVIGAIISVFGVALFFL
ncbi:MAG: DMT family transporter [Bacteroidales bacterium]|nr:DMT family transporter [Candidatus Colicola faecequi]